ncbi:MAG: hypothetical protein QG670_853 [Thermoproteota archaeon]|nr:hypothetical protein [Thermoproteota archaeon]
MPVLLKLSLLFWTPFLIFIFSQRKIAIILYRVIYERGIISPLIFRTYAKASFGTIRNFREFNNYIISSLNLKGVMNMGKIYGIKPDQIQEFEPKGQEGVAVEERLVFLCKSLDVNLAARITDQVYTAKGFGAKREELLRAGTQEIEILRRGLVGWKNYFYDDDTEIEWTTIPKELSKQKADAIMDQNLNKISPELRGQIADFIRGTSTADSD